MLRTTEDRASEGGGKGGEGGGIGGEGGGKGREQGCETDSDDNAELGKSRDSGRKFEFTLAEKEKLKACINAVTRNMLGDKYDECVAQVKLLSKSSRPPPPSSRASTADRRPPVIPARLMGSMSKEQLRKEIKIAADRVRGSAKTDAKETTARKECGSGSSLSTKKEEESESKADRSDTAAITEAPQRTPPPILPEAAQIPPKVKQECKKASQEVRKRITFRERVIHAIFQRFWTEYEKGLGRGDFPHRFAIDFLQIDHQSICVCNEDSFNAYLTLIHHLFIPSIFSAEEDQHNMKQKEKCKNLTKSLSKTWEFFDPGSGKIYNHQETILILDWIILVSFQFSCVQNLWFKNTDGSVSTEEALDPNKSKYLDIFSIDESFTKKTDREQRAEIGLLYFILTLFWVRMRQDKSCFTVNLIPRAFLLPLFYTNWPEIEVNESLQRYITTECIHNNPTINIGSMTPDEAAALTKRVMRHYFVLHQIVDKWRVFVNFPDVFGFRRFFSTYNFDLDLDLNLEESSRLRARPDSELLFNERSRDLIGPFTCRDSATGVVHSETIINMSHPTNISLLLDMLIGNVEIARQQKACLTWDKDDIPQKFKECYSSVVGEESDQLKQIAPLSFPESAIQAVIKTIIHHNKKQTHTLGDVIRDYMEKIEEYITNAARKQKLEKEVVIELFEDAAATYQAFVKKFFDKSEDHYIRTKNRLLHILGQSEVRVFNFSGRKITSKQERDLLEKKALDFLLQHALEMCNGRIFRRVSGKYYPIMSEDAWDNTDSEIALSTFLAICIVRYRALGLMWNDNEIKISRALLFPFVYTRDMIMKHPALGMEVFIECIQGMEEYNGKTLGEAVNDIERVLKCYKTISKHIECFLASFGNIRGVIVTYFSKHKIKLLSKPINDGVDYDEFYEIVDTDEKDEYPQSFDDQIRETPNKVMVYIYNTNVASSAIDCLISNRL